MAKCYLSDNQRDMIRALAAGLRGGKVQTTWAWSEAGGKIRAIRGLGSELRLGAWKDVKPSDFEVFMNCGFLTRNGFLNEALIFDAVERDFKDDTSLPHIQINISGGDFHGSNVNIASSLRDVEQSVKSDDSSDNN